MNKLYSVHDHWTDINKKNDVDIESIDGVITGIKVNGKDYGGSTWNKVFTGAVVTHGEAAPFSGTINAVLSGADTIKVSYNGTKYILPKQVTDDGIFYGATPGATPSEIDFSEIPFLIRLGEGNTALYTQAPGPHIITIFEPASGGGESDFSTAEVSVINTTSNSVTAAAVAVMDTPISAIASFSSIRGNSNRSYIIPLYKGLCSWQINSGDVLVSVSGNISYEDGYVDITGDGTITISQQ